MEIMLKKLTANFLGFTTVLCFSLIFNENIAYAAAKANSCETKRIAFKKLYLELQALYLNYEGQDSVIDDKGNLRLVPHDKKNPEYVGKLFEAAVFSQYQNALKKVAKLYQTANFSGNIKLKQEVPGLVSFLQALESKENNSDFLKNNTIANVLNDLQKASKIPNISKFTISNDDKYLLKKLLTHAQDRLCNLESYQNTGKRTHDFTVEELEAYRQAPLNRLIDALKNAKINAESELIVNEKSAIDFLPLRKLENVDQDTTIQSTIAEHVEKLGKWMRENKACREAISNPSFLQANVQPCNYNKFLGVLAGENPEEVPPPGIFDENKLEKFQAILHFINANEKYLSRPQAKAETALDELKLESYIDSTFANLGQRIGCTEVKNPNGSKRIFVRNLPFINNDFDRSKLTCKIKNKTLSASECKQKIEFVSDEFGRGVEVRQKEKTGPVVTFSLTENPDCNDLSTEQPRKPVLTEEQICALPENKDKKIMKYGKCIDKPALTEEQICAQPENKDKKIMKDGKCIDKPALTEEQICAQPENKDKKIMKDGKCIDRPLSEEQICDQPENKDKKIMKDGKCIDKPLSEEQICALPANKDKKTMKDGKCIDKPLTEEQICAQPENKDKKVMIDGKCVNKPIDNQAQKDCEKKNEKWKKDSGKERGIRYSWNEDKKTCDDLRPEPTDAGEKAEKDDSIPIDTTPKQVPSSFVPINIPTRHMSVLPGMP